MIHPSAIVHPDAQIGPDCEIGPYCVIGAHVVLGAGSVLHSHVVIDGHTRLGQRNFIYPFASIGLRTQDLKWKGGVTRTEIGDDNIIRENVTIHSATGDGETTLIGSNNAFLAGTHLAHNVQVGNRVIVSGAMIAGHVLVEDGAVVSGVCGIHQFCRIGTLSMVGGLSRISQDVAPYMLVNGNPPETVAINKVGLTRNNIPAETQNALRAAHKILFREGLAVSNALARIEHELPPLPEVRHLVEFVRSSERGITG